MSISLWLRNIGCCTLAVEPSGTFHTFYSLNFFIAIFDLIIKGVKTENQRQE